MSHKRDKRVPVGKRVKVKHYPQRVGSVTSVQLVERGVGWADVIIGMIVDVLPAYPVFGFEGSRYSLLKNEFEERKGGSCYRRGRLLGLIDSIRHESAEVEIRNFSLRFWKEEEQWVADHPLGVTAKLTVPVV